MRVKIAIIVVLSLIAGLSLCWVRHSSSPEVLGAMVSVEPTTLEVRLEDEAAPLTFIVRNRGNAVVDIADVTATCGCTVVKVPRRKLGSQESMMIEVHATPPSVGERTSTIAIHTNPPQQLPLSVLVTLKGKEQAAPFVSYCPDTLTLKGSVFGETSAGLFEIHTIEETGTKPWIAEEQFSDPKLRIWFDEAPVEEPLDSKTIRRVYRMKVAAVLPSESESQTGRHRHVIATLSKSTSPEKTIAIECQVIPLVKAAPAVLNLIVASGVSGSLERTVVVIDDRESRPSHPVRSRPEHDWLTVKSIKADVQEGRSIHSFQVVVDPQQLTANPGDTVFRTSVTFFLDEDETTSLRVPIFVRID